MYLLWQFRGQSKSHELLAVKHDLLALSNLLHVITWICHIWWMDFSKLLLVFVKIVNWTCQIWCMDFSKLIHGFFRIDTCTFKLLHGFVKDATGICYIYVTKLLDVFFVFFDHLKEDPKSHMLLFQTPHEIVREH